MTPQEKSIWLEQVLAILGPYLEKEIGYPFKHHNNQIMDRLKPMWDLLVQNNLIKDGMTLELFLKEAQAGYIRAELGKLTNFF